MFPEASENAEKGTFGKEVRISVARDGANDDSEIAPSMMEARHLVPIGESDVTKEDG